jgi:hypothetical protein
MYLALWIDESQDTPPGRVVVCTPLLKRENTAVAVLRGVAHADSLSLIFSGERDALSTMAEELVRVDRPEFTPQQLIGKVRGMADFVGVSEVEFDAKTVTAAVKVPRAGLYPRAITPDAKPIWDETVKRFEKTIKRYSDNRKKWAAAIVIFQRLAAERGVRPFVRDVGTDKLRNDLGREINRRLNRSNHHALQLVRDTFDQNGELLARLGTERFYEAAWSNKTYYVTTVQVLRPRRGVEPARVIAELMRQRWGGQAGRYVFRAVDQWTSVLIEPYGQDLAAYIASAISRAQVILLFALPEDATHAAVIEQLKSAGRRWVKTGTLVEIPRGSSPR